jgi:hypothetical protein
VSGTGVGPAGIGMPIGGIAAALPGFTEAPSEACSFTTFSNGAVTLTIPLALSGRVETVIVTVDGTVSVTPRTGKGIGLGSTTAAVEAAYPGIAPVIGPEFSTFSLYPVPDGGRFVVILVDGGLVESLRVQDEAMIPMDLC